MKNFTLAALLMLSAAGLYGQEQAAHLEKPVFYIYTRVEGWNDSVASVSGLELSSKGPLHYFMGLRYIYLPAANAGLRRPMGFDFLPLGLGYTIADTPGGPLITLGAAFLTGMFFESSGAFNYTIPIGLEASLKVHVPFSGTGGVFFGFTLSPQWSYTYNHTYSWKESFQFRYGFSFGFCI